MSDGQVSKDILQFSLQAWVVSKVDNAIHQINHYPVDSRAYVINTYLLDND